MSHQTFPKPRRGDALLERRTKRAATVRAEQAEMQAALKRDGRKCRWPGCIYAAKKLPIDACHVVQHRGMGGNPRGDRTTRNQIMTLCRIHHGKVDARELSVEPKTDAGTDGACAFFRWAEHGGIELVAEERTIGISETRGA
jgi:hypothetical protein